MKPYETRLIARELSKYVLHERCDRVGHYPTQKGYSYTCDGQRIAVKAAKFAENRKGWLFWTRRVDADQIMFVAFGRDSKVFRVWLVPFDVLGVSVHVFVREDELDIWDEYELEININIINLLGVK